MGKSLHTPQRWFRFLTLFKNTDNWNNLVSRCVCQTWIFATSDKTAHKSLRWVKKLQLSLLNYKDSKQSECYRLLKTECLNANWVWLIQEWNCQNVSKCTTHMQAENKAHRWREGGEAWANSSFVRLKGYNSFNGKEGELRAVTNILDLSHWGDTVVLLFANLL